MFSSPVAEAFRRWGRRRGVAARWTGTACRSGNASGHSTGWKPCAAAHRRSPWIWWDRWTVAATPPWAGTCAGHRRRHPHQPFAEVRHRLRDAGQLQPRTTLTGDVLPPDLLPPPPGHGTPACSTSSTCTFKDSFGPTADIHPDTAKGRKPSLAERPPELRPTSSPKSPTGSPSTLPTRTGVLRTTTAPPNAGSNGAGRQRPDGMSAGRLIATRVADPRCAAGEVRRTRMCNPEDQTPTVTDEPTQATVDADRQSQHAQRQHRRSACQQLTW